MSELPAANGVKDWHASKQIGKRARYLLEHPDEEIPSDVTFLIGNGKDEPQKMFKCHKFILAMVSSMFQAMFYGSFPQTDGIVKVPDVTPAAFQHMLRYAYGVDNEPDNIKCLDDALDTLFCAKKYLIAKLERACRDYIQLQIVPLREDSCVVLHRAPQMDEEDLATLALVNIARYFTTIMEGDAFPRLSFDSVKLIVDNPHLNARETDIYQGVRRWIEHNVGAVTGSALRDALGSLLYSIRFPLFSAKELADGPVTDGVLSGDELSGIFKFLHATVKPPLPFLTAPRIDMLHSLRCDFDLVMAPGSGRSTKPYMYARPDLAPESCAFLEQLVKSKLHIRIASFDNEHVGKTVPLPVALPEERNVLSHSVKGACWFEWDIEKGAACNVRIGTGGKPRLHHSAVFGFVVGSGTKGSMTSFSSWNDRRIQGVRNFRCS